MILEVKNRDFKRIKMEKGTIKGRK
jgi:hypothetical protein